MINLPVIRNTLSPQVSRLKAWALTALICVAGLSAAPAMADEHKSASGKLDNATCQTCHDGKKGKLEVKNDEGKARALHAVENDKYGKSVHAKMQCVTCHTEIIDAKEKHQINTKAKKPDCASCHEALWDKTKKEGHDKQKPRLGDVVQNIADYKKSLHARENADDETRSNASCNDCHDVHSFNIPPKSDKEARKEWRANNPKLCGTSCHEDQLEEFTDSIHGQKLLDEGEMDAAICSDCHTSHSVGNTSTATVKQAITESCGDCHDKQFHSYERTQHGKLAVKTGGNPVRCMDCHGSHGIALLTKLPDTRKTVAQDNKMCISCHTSDKKFEKFAPLVEEGKLTQVKADAKAAGKKMERPDLDTIHSWLPNTKLHWQSVRCIDCHTAAAEEKSHEILGQKKAERKCVTCHTRNSSLATRLYRHKVAEEKQLFGFSNSIILTNSYVIGATRHPLLDTIIMIIAGLTLLGVLGHGAVRYVTGKSRRKNAK